MKVHFKRVGLIAAARATGTVQVTGLDRQDVTADKHGTISFNIRSDSTSAKIRMTGFEPAEYELKLGELQKAKSGQGVIDRLKNLGFFPPLTTDPSEDETSSAVKLLQQAHGLAPEAPNADGSVNANTRKKLAKLNGA